MTLHEEIGEDIHKYKIKIENIDKSDWEIKFELTIKLSSKDMYTLSKAIANFCIQEPDIFKPLEIK